MNKFIMLLLIIIATSLSAKISKQYIDDAFSEAAEKVGVDENLLKAVCWVESNHNPHAYRHSDAPGTNALGMCQILYPTAKSLGLDDDKCSRDFDEFSSSERDWMACQLFGPKTNALYAAKYLKSLMDNYHGNEFKAVLAYNAGRYISCESGWLSAWLPDSCGNYQKRKFKRCLKGGPVNMYYAHKVISAMDHLDVLRKKKGELICVETKKEDLNLLPVDTTATLNFR